MRQGKRSRPSAAEWPNLPDELLGMVRLKLASPRDRVRFAAVCSSWRAAASRQPLPPALPLLLLSPQDEDKEKRLYCLEDGGILRVPVTSRLCDMWINGSYDGGWIAAGSMNPGLSVVIVNLFSGVEVELSAKQRRIECVHHRGPYVAWKIIFSEAPTSGGCILAAMTDTCNIALCRIGCPDSGWTTEGCERAELGDIAFCQGKLYGLTRCSENLLRYDIGENKDGAPVVTAAHPLTVQSRDGPICNSRCSLDYASYIFELRGNLAMAVMIRWSENRQAFFKVFELAQSSSNDDAHDYRILIVNLFSGAELTLSEKHEGVSVSCPEGSPSPVIWKIIFSDTPTSSSCILAVMATENLMETDSKFYIALRRLSCPDGWRKVQGHDREGIADIMFYRGKLYGLTRFSECLLRLDIGVDHNGAPVVTAARRLAVQKRDGPKSTGKRVSDFSTYLFELRGNLAMAVKAIWSKQTDKPYFRVYELVDTTSTDGTHIYKWSEVHSLGSHALFLGPRCSSKAVDVPAGGRGGVEGNHIYYTSHYCLPEEEEVYKPCVTRSVDAGTMYFMEEQSVGDGFGDMDRIPSLGYYVRGSIYLPTWCFPPDM
ncbi:hypothetical protein QYE76_049470 [Lolium multiflorum]|uniref:DUF295 domain-containing protein n=1 Tax=Lolium multiflorum TaxID=4521 RepID=A0AAD8SQ03_LOLMU|nr:hypothetical protein QYE76_049470 [Lolium multiflorum]